jgi:hypothetical protein
MTMRRRTAIVSISGLALLGACLLGATLLTPLDGRASAQNPLGELAPGITAPPPSVISYAGSSSGLELHVVPGQYHPTFDQAFVESFPYASTSADSSPSAAATATPAELGLFLDSYPTAACLISTFSPYCEQIRTLPVDTFFARATSDSSKTQDAHTSFPCEPGSAQPRTVVLSPPACTSPPPPQLVLGDGAAHADATPSATATARIGHLELTVPASTGPAYTARLQRAHDLLAVFHRPTTGVDRAMADSAILSTTGITTLSEFRSGSDGVPRAHNEVVFGALDALGGMVHADGLVLDLAAATLGQARPPVRAETTRFVHLTVLGKDYGDVDSSSCDRVASQIDTASPSQVPGGQQFSLSAVGFRLSCSAVSSSVVTDPARGYGLNPVSQELTGPGLDFVQMQNPLDYLAGAGVQVPQACYPGDKNLPPPPAPPAVPRPLPPAPGPTSTCQFASTNSLADNGVSVHLGHLVQDLAAQPPVHDTGGVFGGVGIGGLGVGGLGAGGVGSLGVGGLGSLGIGGGEYPPLAGLGQGYGRSPSSTAGSSAARGRLVVARLPYRDWLIFGYGAWGCAVLAALGLWGLSIHRRRLGGLL